MKETLEGALNGIDGKILVNIQVFSVALLNYLKNL
jgi:hypothetical protein